jgi:catechol 2,3-dioxygenase-like lactoylglutathione lyase family enzyme
MDLTFQTVFLNATDLNQSIEFYRDVFDVHVISRRDRVAALMISERPRRQVLIVREVGRNAYHGGRGSIGLRSLSFEAGSLDELEIVEQRFAQRQALLWRRDIEGYRAIMGLDPDRVEISVVAGSSGSPIQSQDWTNLDDMIYAIGE